MTAALESRDLEPIATFALKATLLSLWRKEFDGGKRKAARCQCSQHPTAIGVRSLFRGPDLGSICRAFLAAAQNPVDRGGLHSQRSRNVLLSGLLIGRSRRHRNIFFEILNSGWVRRMNLVFSTAVLASTRFLTEASVSADELDPTLAPGEALHLSLEV